ncbi:hypothetical protein GOODEAATRI_032975 [Goodea atripinnis]|uniref:Uncharacterized protein n=1 Tax=Goodea atripinnis TaxID=208336 RepID=A0ABV0N663_9TELE
MHVATVERKNSLLTGRNLQQNQAQCERPSATTDWGFERNISLYRTELKYGRKINLLKANLSHQLPSRIMLTPRQARGHNSHVLDSVSKPEYLAYSHLHMHDGGRTNSIHNEPWPGFEPYFL